ncbi:MAG: hypothetical protein Q4Q21_01760 [Lachnospiraceae bacterium]|nr:hypothetical protein [Lachnospiraceae bacterium]
MVTVQPGDFVTWIIFKGCPYRAPLLVCLPTPVYIRYLLAYWPRPVQANKKSAPVFVRAGDVVSKQPNMMLHGFYECRHVDKGWHRFFTNLLYPNRMPLGFFSVSFHSESMTLSPVTLAQYYPSKISIFDAKLLNSKAVTLSLLCFSSANHQLSQSRRRILNVTESDIS